MPTSSTKVAIVGVGFTPLTRSPERAEVDLGVEACRMAVEDADIDPVEIDGISIQVHHYPPPDTEAIVRRLGIRQVNWYWDGHGRVGAGSLGPVAQAVERGDCRAMLVCKIMNTIAPVGTPNIDPESGSVRGPIQFEAPYGLGYAMQRVGLMARRYMRRYGITEEQVGWLPVTQREHARLHPWAFMKAPLTLEDYLASRWIADPVRLLDCDIPVNGAFAYLVARDDVARALRHPPVYILGWSEGRLGMPMPHLDPEILEGLSPIAETLYRDVGLGPKDMDIAYPYDGFSFFSLIWMEHLGLVGRGEAGAFIEGGTRIGLAGELPLNTHGGQLSQGRLHGHGPILEAVEQLRGTAGPRQVRKPAHHAVISSHIPSRGYAAILGTKG